MEKIVTYNAGSSPLDALKATIDNYIKENGKREITGEVLNMVLTTVVDTLGEGSEFKGLATYGTDPGSPANKCFYLAIGYGNYSYFGVVIDNPPSDYITPAAILHNNSGAWEAIKFNLVNADKFPKYVNMNRLAVAFVADGDHFIKSGSTWTMKPMSLLCGDKVWTTPYKSGTWPSAAGTYWITYNTLTNELTLKNQNQGFADREWGMLQLIIKSNYIYTVGWSGVNVFFDSVATQPFNMLFMTSEKLSMAYNEALTYIDFDNGRLSWPLFYVGNSGMRKSVASGSQSLGWRAGLTYALVARLGTTYAGEVLQMSEVDYRSRIIAMFTYTADGDAILHYSALPFRWKGQLKNVNGCYDELGKLQAGAVFMGMAEPDTNPGTPDIRQWYLATEEGEYEYFGVNIAKACDVDSPAAILYNELPDSSGAGGGWRAINFHYADAILVEDALDEKQDMLSGNYLATLETNGGHIDFTQRSYDGQTTSTKTVDFKTINGQAIIGQGDIKVEGGGSASPFEVASNGGVRRVGNTKNLGLNAFAENTTVTASGTLSHAEGAESTASGVYSHAESSGTASGSNSHAEGYYTTASGEYSHAEGQSTIASNAAEHSSGRFNKSTTSSVSYFNGSQDATLFSVGNGNNAAQRHNAFEVKQNGDFYIADTSAEGDYFEKPMLKLQDVIAELRSRLVAVPAYTLTSGDSTFVQGTPYELSVLRDAAPDAQTQIEVECNGGTVSPAFIVDEGQGHDAPTTKITVTPNAAACTVLLKCTIKGRDYYVGKYMITNAQQ